MNCYANDQVEQIYKNGITYLQFKLFAPYQDVLQHGITLRHGGVSKGSYASLNCRASGQDKVEHVIENITRITTALNIELDHLYKGHQRHSDQVVVLTEENKEAYAYRSFTDLTADGYLYQEPGIASLLILADCIPIILYDPVQKVAANIHSGWAGTIQQIYLKAIDTMVSCFDCKAEDILVGIGPSIKKCCFTSEELSFKEKFTNIWEREQEYIFYEQENPDRFHIDLFYVIYQDLLKKGIKKEHISHMDICTKCHSQDFFSYRDAVEKGYPNGYGLMGVIVGISKNK